MTSPVHRDSAAPNLKDTGAAILRKTVAIFVGYALAYLARRWHIALDADTSQAGVMFAVALLATVYGTVVNFLELKFPALGWLLGLARQPKFVNQEGGDATTLGGRELVATPKVG